MNSGKVQINNDVFQMGGYITVADFVEKYKENYDILYKGIPYGKCSEYLLEYHNYSDGSTPYSMTMTQKARGR